MLMDLGKNMDSFTNQETSTIRCHLLVSFHVTFIIIILIENILNLTYVKEQIIICKEKPSFSISSGESRKNKIFSYKFRMPAGPGNRREFFETGK